MTMENNQNDYVANAFVSCSLSPTDQPFVKYIEKILRYHGINPFGTVGRYSASPENPVELMKKNIHLADFVVIIATPRYLQKDLWTGEVSYGLSEMVHVETGIAYANDKPVVVFVQEGIDVGNFIPNVTQYITLNGSRNEFIEKKNLILDLLNNAYGIVQQMKKNKTLNTVGKVAVTGLAILGGIKLLEAIFSEGSNEE